MHDAGKATDAFVRRLEGEAMRVDHSSFGARLPGRRLGRLGLLLAYMVAGHHGGLPDGGEQEGDLHFRLKGARIPADVELLPMVDLHKELRPPFELTEERAGFSLAFFTRMIFSCLVDADFLDTEAFCTPEKLSGSARKADPRRLLVPIAGGRLLTGILRKGSDGGRYSGKPACARRCWRSAGKRPRFRRGFFSLTVPTGGGKTLSSLAFALDHAVAHGLRRVIYAIPFTSIIEQNAGSFEEVLGREAVLEHHCNYKERDAPEEAAYERRRGLGQRELGGAGGRHHQCPVLRIPLQQQALALPQAAQHRPQRDRSRRGPGDPH